MQLKFLNYNREHPELNAATAKRMNEYLLSPEGRKFVLSCSKAKPIRFVKTGEEFPSAHAAEKLLGYRGIHKACSGLQNICGGYHWEYIRKPGELQIWVFFYVFL